MGRSIPRRDFLKTASAAASAFAYAASHPLAGAEAQVPKPADIQLSGTPYTPIPDYPIRPTRHAAVTLTDTFWKPKVTTNATVTIPFEVQKLTDNGRTLSGNVLEAAILSLETHPDAALQAQVDAAVQALAARSGGGNNGFEVAAAYYQATGKRVLVEHAIKAADALYDDFKVNDPPFSGGERDAINCVQLYRVTHDKKYLDLAKHYLDIRGLENSVNRSRHNQSYKPVLQQSEAVGHAVNCVSLMVSLADVGVLTGIKDYFDAAQRMWTDAASKKMYITGGVGSTGNEGFGDAYSLPNISAYSETCAVLMFITLNHRLFLATGDSAYIDVMERGMYNNAIAGVSDAGDRFFYVNRLASAGDGRDLRWQRASLECCPPNLVRFLAGMPGFIYAQDPTDAVYLNLYVSSDASFKISDRTLRLSVESEMPWGGRSRVTVSTSDKADVRGTIKLRIPGWARNQPAPGTLYRYVNRVDRQHVVSVNNRQVIAVPDKLGYVTLDRNWKNGDVVEIDFPVAPRRVVADQRVKANAGRIAAERGPIVYCAEWPEVEGRHVLGLAGRHRSFTGAVGQHGFLRRRPCAPHRGHERHESRAARAAARPDSLLPVGESRRRRDERVAAHARIQGRRHRPVRRMDLLRESELRDRWLAVPRGGAGQSKRRRQVGVLPDAHHRSPRHRDWHGQTEHTGDPQRLSRSRHRRGALRQLRAQRRRRVVPAVTRRARAAVSRPQGPRPRGLWRYRPRRQLQLLGLVTADH